MTRRRVVAVASLAFVVLAGCSGSSESADRDEAVVTSSSTSTAPAPTFTGDADSPFCRLLETADERPVRDPFEAGLDPREVEIRMRALQLRFGEFADVAPSELSGEIEQLVASLDELDETLADAGYDFGTLAEQDADVSAFDAPAFADTATRIGAYRDQVCAGA